MAADLGAGHGPPGLAPASSAAPARAVAPASAPSRRLWLLAAAGSLAAAARPGRVRADAPFDHAHAAWTALLRRHVVLLDGGRALRLRYAGMAADRGALRAYLAELSAVSAPAFDAFSPAQRKAFLINAYNAFTVELVLTRYPDLASIRELGSFLQSPWKRRFVPLLGATLSLDDIEHGELRVRGRHDDPRIHFALNCASVGCPMLREEAYAPARLEAQLDEQVARFLSDRSRNRWDAVAGRLEISKIFDWYAEDFALGHRGLDSVMAFFARHAELLADAPADRARIRTQQVPVSHLPYDWALNDAAGRS